MLHFSSSVPIANKSPTRHVFTIAIDHIHSLTFTLKVFRMQRQIYQPFHRHDTRWQLLVLHPWGVHYTSHGVYIVPVMGCTLYQCYWCCFTDRCPSHVFQEHLAEICITESASSIQFINGLLNQLNLVFSEVMSLVQTVMNSILTYPVSNVLSLQLHSAENGPSPKQLRTCTTCYNITVSLLRVSPLWLYCVPSTVLYHESW